MLKLILCLAVCFAVVGCQANVEPLERTANRMIDEVVKPAVAKATEELATRSAQLSGQGSAINPGYVIDGYGVFGSGIVYRATIRLDGVSANLAGATQSDQGPDLTKALTTRPAQ